MKGVNYFLLGLTHNAHEAAEPLFMETIDFDENGSVRVGRAAPRAFCGDELFV